MAKWGEGDPRWLVEHRDDGRNVNGWHWSETNKMEWTKQRLGELLPGAEARSAAASEAAPDGWVARVKRVKSVTGEAMLTTRKGNKRFGFYDLNISLEWEAMPVASGTAAAPAAAAGAPADAAAAADALAGASLECTAAAAEGAAQPASGGEAGAGEAAPAENSKEAAAVVSGTMDVKEFGSGGDHDDVEITVTVSAGGSAAEQAALRRHAETTLWPAVLRQLEQYVKELNAS
ncbi:activator of 90 kDa heat shock ATPase-like protein 2 isoform X2 [Chlorella sorokiniana]|uniref:Activator of 90 kDa heat shock ATPase-like protein 2 isoform X2 n=1 Tax=Chlorella sorokiniana TaxID=3076 RepID=A0A2P6U442_CHLSO|nr:activator of 90 kDa heat shock ATPase-like protein 2 isoform X2 [Chlorella sorokiniana]|eukprot:PRW61075.1 activator of 90 kDa heat shock ATPase-like protein 2 isoform X2 [Chlorella sorokiniana]